MAHDNAQIHEAVKAKSIAIELYGRQAYLAPNTYFAYAIYTVINGQRELLYVTPSMNFGSNDAWVNAATDKFAEITGVPVEYSHLPRWGRENGIDVAASIEDVTSEWALNDFIGSHTA